MCLMPILLKNKYMYKHIGLSPEVTRNKTQRHIMLIYFIDQSLICLSWRMQLIRARSDHFLFVPLIPSLGGSDIGMQMMS